MELEGAAASLTAAAETPALAALSEYKKKNATEGFSQQMPSHFAPDRVWQALN